MGVMTITMCWPAVSWSAASWSPPPPPWGCRGSGRWPTATTKIARPSTAMSRRARPQWRRSLRVGGGIERCALYATDNQESEPRGIKKSPFSLCDCLCSGILPLERADSARTIGKPSGGLHHAEDSNCAGCILGDAERCRCCRPASQGAAASGASSGWQVAGRQGSDWQISTSRARRDQGLTVCVLDARKIERSGYAFHYHAYAPLPRGFSFWN